MNMTSILRWAALATVVISAGCGQKADRGAFLDIGVSGFGSIVAIPSSSCSDFVSAKEAGTTIPERSLAKYSARFSSFQLQWSDTERTLEITRLRVFVRGSNLTSREFKIEFDTTEIQTLLASEDLIIPAATKDADGKVVPVTIRSNDTAARGSGSIFAPCGFNLGGIPVKNENIPFSATIQVELAGVAVKTDGSGEGASVKETVTVNARYD